MKFFSLFWIGSGGRRGREVINLTYLIGGIPLIGKKKSHVIPGLYDLFFSVYIKIKSLPKGASFGVFAAGFQ